MERTEHRHAQWFQDRGRPGREQHRRRSAVRELPAANNYTLQNTSPAINRGSPALQYLLEPIGVGNGNGDRIDIGAQGGTAQANPSPAQATSNCSARPAARPIRSVGRRRSRSARRGLLGLIRTVFMNAGGGAVMGSPSWNAWQGSEYATLAGYQYTNTTAVDRNGLNVPSAVLQDFTLVQRCHCRKWQIHHSGRRWHLSGFADFRRSVFERRRAASFSISSPTGSPRPPITMFIRRPALPTRRPRSHSRSAPAAAQG